MAKATDQGTNSDSVSSQTKKKGPLVIIFLTVFIFLAGFGIVIPLIPLLGKQYGGSSFEVGLLMAAYSGMQFLFSPFWGKMSDRVGRRPVLLMCLVGEGLSYVLFALSKSYEMLLLSRFLAGFFGASISTASAYISDVTPQNERSKGMALIGAAFGLGFLIGPVMGGGLTLWGNTLSSEPGFGITFAGFWVAGLCFANFLFALKFLPESLKEKKVSVARLSRWLSMSRNLKKPLVGSLIAVYFISSFAMSTMEVALVLFMSDKFKWGETQILWGFAYVGLMSVICQGFLVRRLLPKLGEKKVLLMGLSFMALALSSVAWVPSAQAMAISMTLLALGTSFTNPAALGSISLLSSAEDQGEVLGTAQGTASLGRILGPVLGGFLYQSFSISSPFYASGLIAAIGALIVFSQYRKLPDSAKGIS